jgi:RNA polymerase sigma-70 factor (ECF subfamily)
MSLEERPVIVNGAAGVLTLRDGEPFSLVGVIVRNGRIAEIDIIADPERLRSLDLTALHL